MVSAGTGGVGPGFTKPWGYSMTTGYGIAGPESATSPIGPINLQMKLAGKPGTGKPYAGFDEAGIGNGLTEYRANPRPYLGEAGVRFPRPTHL